jgi:hypothetical protein
MKPSFFKAPSRSLWIKVPPTDEIIIGNNTAIFATLASLQNHGKDKHPKLKVIWPTFWLDHVHHHYLEEKWGQTVHGLPNVAKQLYLNIYPHHPQNDFITWGQYQNLRFAAKNIIENQYKIPVYHGDPVIERTTDGNFEIKVKSDNGAVQFSTAADTQFYLWYRVPNFYKIDGIIQKTITDIYRLSPHELSNDVDIITLGAGLSVIWLAKYFTNPLSSRKIICIKHKDDQLNFNVPSNGCVSRKNIIEIDVETCEMRISEHNPKHVIIKSKEYQKEFQGYFYSAIGHALPASVVKNIPKAQLMSPEQWVFSRWISPKNVPYGSLMESIIQWYEITNNLGWGGEHQNYHEDGNSFRLKLKEKFPSELKIDERYFSAVAVALLDLNNPLPDSKLIQFFTNIYQDVYHPHDSQVEIFKNNLKELLEDYHKSGYNYTESKLDAYPHEFTI